MEKLQLNHSGFIGEISASLQMVPPLRYAYHLARGLIISPWLLPLAHLSTFCSGITHKSSHWRLWKMFGWYSNVFLMFVLGVIRPYVMILLEKCLYTEIRLFHLHYDLGATLIHVTNMVFVWHVWFEGCDKTRITTLVLVRI